MSGAALRKALQLRPQFCSERTITSFRELAQLVVSCRPAMRHSMPFHLRGQKCILADKSFLSNYVGIQGAFFSISSISKWWKVWENLFTNKNIKGPSVQAGVGINERIRWDTDYRTCELAAKQACPCLQFIKETQSYPLGFFQILERDPKSSSHILESKDPSSWQTSTHLPKGLLNSTGKLKICHRKKGKKKNQKPTTKPRHMLWSEADFLLGLLTRIFPMSTAIPNILNYFWALKRSRSALSSVKVHLAASSAAPLANVLGLCTRSRKKNIVMMRLI